MVSEKGREGVKRLDLQLTCRFEPLEGSLQVGFVVPRLTAQNPTTVALCVLVVYARRQWQNETPLHIPLTATKFKANRTVAQQGGVYNDESSLITEQATAKNALQKFQ